MRFYQRSLDGKIGCQIRKTGIGRTGNHFHRQTSSTASRQVRFIHSFCQRLYQAEQTGEGEEVDSKDHSPNEGSLKLTVALSAIAPNSVNVAACFHLTNWTWQAYKYSERLREGATGQTINQKRFPACLMTMKSLSLGLPAVGQWQQSNSGGATTWNAWYFPYQSEIAGPELHQRLFGHCLKRLVNSYLSIIFQPKTYE